MRHKCFISFKTEDVAYKKYIQDKLDIDMIDKSLNEAIDSDDEDYIMKKIRKDYLSNSTVTIFLIGQYSAENSWGQNQNFIKRELQASLYDGEKNTRSGILGVVLPNMYDTIYKGQYSCMQCGNSHTYVGINESTVIKEFSVNYYIPKEGKCSWSEDDRYCVLVKWDDFKDDPEKYIDQAFEKKNQSIAEQVKVYPK